MQRLNAAMTVRRCTIVLSSDDAASDLRRSAFG
jgi:hypothetical protein